MNKYANAFTEVYEILGCLNEEEFEKIPKQLIKIIENNRNRYYNYIMNSETDLAKQEMLPETKAILFNIFRDYLSTPKQKEIIIKMQSEKYEKIEEQKRKKYDIDVFEKNIDLIKKEKKTEEMSLKPIENGFIIRLLKKIRNIFVNIIR